MSEEKHIKLSETKEKKIAHNENDDGGDEQVVNDEKKLNEREEQLGNVDGEESEDNVDENGFPPQQVLQNSEKDTIFLDYIAQHRFEREEG